MREHYGFAYPDTDTTSRTPEAERKAAVEQTWEEFWLPIFKRLTNGCEEFGNKHAYPHFLAALKVELYDYSQMMSNTSEVFSALTSTISKPHTMAEHVIAEAQELQRKYAVMDVIEVLEHDLERRSQEEWLGKSSKQGGWQRAIEHLKEEFASDLAR